PRGAAPPLDALPHLHAHDGGSDPLGRADHGARIGVEQVGVGRGGDVGTVGAGGTAAIEIADSRVGKQIERSLHIPKTPAGSRLYTPSRGDVTTRRHVATYSRAVVS